MNKEIIGDDYPTYEDSVKMTLKEGGQDGMYLDENNTWRMACGCTEANVLDGNHNECNKNYTYMTEIEHTIFKSEAERVLEENKSLKRESVNDKILLSRALHRLACIESDIKLVSQHILANCDKQFQRPSLNEDGTVFAEEAWHNISNIEIACDLNNKESLDWESRVKNNENKV